MGKLLPMLLALVAINLAIVIFVGGTPPGSSLWTMIVNPQDWGNLGMMTFVTDSLLLIGAVGIIIGTFTKAPAFITFAGISTVFLSFGMSFAELYNQFNAWDVLSSSHSYFAIIFAAPLVISYLYIILKFWTNTD